MPEDPKNENLKQSDYDKQLENKVRSNDLERSTNEILEKRNEILRIQRAQSNSVASDLNKIMTEIDMAHGDAMRAALKQTQLEMDFFKESRNSAEDHKMRRNIASAASQVKADIERVGHLNKLLDAQLKKLEKIREKHDFIRNTVFTTLGIQNKQISSIMAMSSSLGKFFGNLSQGKTLAIAVFAEIVKFGIETFKTFDKSAWEFRKWAGSVRGATKHMRLMAESMAIDLAHIGVNIDGTYASIKALSSATGGWHNVTKDLVKTTSILSAQLGVSEENTAGMLQNLAGISNTSMQSNQNMVYFAHSMSEAAGVPLNLVMGDVAKLSGTALSMLSKSPLAITKAAVEARKLGTELNKLAEAGSSMLDFTNSVNAEMEASVQLGKNLNLQRIRQLFWENKISEATDEIINKANEVDFTNLDKFQMEAFAKAVGMGVDQLTHMLVAKNNLDKARSSKDPNIQASLKAYESLKLANEASAKSASTNVALQLEQQYNQEKMVALQNKWNQFLMKTSQLMLPIADLALSIAIALVSVIDKLPFLLVMFSDWGKIGNSILSVVTSIFRLTNANVGTWYKTMQVIRGIGSSISKVFAPIAWLITKLKSVGAIFAAWAPRLVPFFSILKSVGAIFAAWAPKLAPFFSIFKLLLGPVGLVIMAFQAISGAIDGWSRGVTIFEKIAQAVRGMLAAIIPFGDEIFSWMGWAKEPIVANVVKKVDIQGEQVDDEQYSSVVRSSRAEDQEYAAESRAESNNSLNNILAAINNLNSNLESGKIGVYVDGQLVSATIARQTNFKGGFGMNVA